MPTFVNPEPRKGIHVFARIAEVFSQRRPDIPLLIVEGAERQVSCRDWESTSAASRTCGSFPIAPTRGISLP